MMLIVKLPTVQSKARHRSMQVHHTGYNHILIQHPATAGNAQPRTAQVGNKLTNSFLQCNASETQLLFTQKHATPKMTTKGIKAGSVYVCGGDGEVDDE